MPAALDLTTVTERQTHGAAPVAPVARAADKPYRGLWQRLESGPLLAFATVLFLLATTIMLMEGTSRSLLDESYFWAEEAVRYLMLWAFFLTLGAAGSAGNHIRTELLVERMPAGVRRVMHSLASLVGVAFGGFLFWASIPQLQRYYTMGMMTDSNLDLPLWALFLAMPLGALLLCAYYLRSLVRALRGEDPFAARHGATGSEL